MHLSDYEKSMLQNVNAQVEVAQPQNTGKTINFFCLAKGEIRFGQKVWKKKNQRPVIFHELEPELTGNLIIAGQS